MLATAGGRVFVGAGMGSPIDRTSTPPESGGEQGEEGPTKDRSENPGMRPGRRNHGISGKHLHSSVFGLVLALLLAAGAPVQAFDEVARLLMQLDYVRVDYPEAVVGGEILDEAEFAEMREFTRSIEHAASALPESLSKKRIQTQAADLRTSIASRAPADQVSALTRSIRDLVLLSYPVASVPADVPDLVAAEQVYRSSCASCHGPGGRGDGPAARGLDPPPVDFQDTHRAEQRSLHGLYNTITLGVPGTGMPSFTDLTEAERWGLAFYVGSMYLHEEALKSGGKAWEEHGGLTLREAVILTPSELASSLEMGGHMAAWARARPKVLFSDAEEPLAAAITRIEASAAAYRGGDRDRARSLALSAYLEGFELAEVSLAVSAPDLVHSVEGAMMALRRAIELPAPPSEVEERAHEIVRLLERSRLAMRQRRLTPAVAFGGSVLILLREGLEAILLLSAMAALLIQTGRRDALTGLHLGWIAALLAGAATWAASRWVIDISGATREITEGVAALLASAVLFYVGFWMHRKMSAERWSGFLRETAQRSLEGRGAVGLVAISFLAVYREVFESILFYQALWTQVDGGGKNAVVVGILVAAATLVVLGWLVLKMGMRLPLRQFFGLSGALMFALAVIFAGKGVVALQEAGALDASPLDLPRIELLGVYPSAQGLGAQLLVVTAALVLLWWNRRDASRRSSC